MNRIFIALILVAASVAGFMLYQVGRIHEKSHWLSLENSTLREQAKEIARQADKAAKAQKEYIHAQDEINRFAVRLSQSDRLRVQSEHRAKIEQATSANLRIYARGLHDLYSACRKEFEAVGLEGARAASGVGALNVK
jgi:regulator of replication initiation timing